jgi:translation initiation factor IF-3
LAKRFPSNFQSKQDDARFQYKLNADIRVTEIRLVGDNLDEVSQVAGKEIEPGIYNTRLVRDWAEAMGQDLIMISPNADPPVCRIIEFNKFLYNKRKKEKEIKANTSKTVIKEIRFGPNTDEHDFEFKTKHAQKFLEDGSKVKAYVHFRGRTIVFKERGELLLLKMLKELEEYGAAESLPKLEGRRMIVMIAPKKKK